MSSFYRGTDFGASSYILGTEKGTERDPFKKTFPTL